MSNSTPYTTKATAERVETVQHGWRIRMTLYMLINEMASLDITEATAEDHKHALWSMVNRSLTPSDVLSSLWHYKILQDRATGGDENKRAEFIVAIEAHENYNKDTQPRITP